VNLVIWSFGHLVIWSLPPCVEARIVHGHRRGELANDRINDQMTMTNSAHCSRPAAPTN
jgi:hypothetical protein